MLIPQDRALLDTELAISWQNDLGWFCSVSKVTPLSLDKLIHHFEQVKVFNGGKKVCFLVKPIFFNSADANCRRYINTALEDQAKALAFLSSTAMERMGLNIFLKINPLNFPTKIFPNEIEAAKWLQQFS